MSLIRHAQHSLSYRRSLMLDRHHATSCLIWSRMVACILTERHPATYLARVQLGHLDDVAGLWVAQLSWKLWVLQPQLWLPELQLLAVMVHLQDLCLRLPWQALFLHSNSTAGQMHVSDVVHLDVHTHKFLHSFPSAERSADMSLCISMHSMLGCAPSTHLYKTLLRAWCVIGWEYYELKISYFLICEHWLQTSVQQHHNVDFAESGEHCFATGS